MYLVCGQNMREEVAAAGSQQVDLLADIILQFVEACFGSAHLGLNLIMDKEISQLKINTQYYVSHVFEQ